MGDLDEYIFDDDGNPVMQCPNFPQEESEFANEDDCKDIFHIKGDGYDVCLSLARGLISWTNVNPSGKKKKSKNKGENRNTVMLKDVFGVRLKRKKTSGNNEEDNGVCLGFMLHICDMYGPNTLSERVVVFEHPSEAMCTRYVRKIHEYMATLKGRPKSIKIFLQNHAGLKNGNTLLKSTAQPLFNSADINVDCVEVQHNEHIKQEMVHINLDDYDCIVAMGGDGTVNKVADGLMTASQKYRDIDQKPGFTPTKARIPLGIIPIGCTNDIGRSIIGSEHIASAVLYIIMGRSMGVDICSTYTEDHFQQWCFNCQYGFAGNVLKFRKRYKALGKRGLEPAFVKALTKAKLRTYKCDIEYIPADKPLPSSRKFIPCWRGCDVCWDEVIPDGDVVTQDLVQAFDPLDESNNSDTLVNLAELEENPWRTKKLDYLNIALYTLPARSDLAPRGQSKFSHLNDGYIDLVLIKDAPRKEFIRVLKRLTNSKNQYDFPFVEVIRAKEVKFRLRLPTGFNYKDYNYSEIDYEINRQQKQIDASVRSDDILEINELSDSENEQDIPTIPERNGKNGKENVQSKSSPRVNGNGKPKPFVKSKSVQQIDKKKLKRSNTDTSITMYGDISDGDEDTDDEDTDDGSEDSNEIVSINSAGVRTVRSASAPEQRLVGPQYRQTFAEQERARRSKRAQRKEEKKKDKEEQKMKTVWNIDNEICNEDTLHVKVHHGLLRVYGQGIAPDAVYSEPSLLCIR